MSTYRERREQRADQLSEWAEGNDRKSVQSFDRAREISQGYEFGQPILVGHHSEKRHRRDIARVESAMDKGVEHHKKADRQRSTAANIERQLDRSIYSDDADAIERLEERIEALEAQRSRIKAINATIRKHKIDFLNIDPDDGNAMAEANAALEPLALTAKEWEDLRCAVSYSRFGRGYPPYALQNLSGNINRQRKRLAKLRDDAARRLALATAERRPVTLTGKAIELTGRERKGQLFWWLRDDVGQFIDMPEDCPAHKDVSGDAAPGGRHLHARLRSQVRWSPPAMDCPGRRTPAQRIRQLLAEPYRRPRTSGPASYKESAMSETRKFNWQDHEYRMTQRSPDAGDIAYKTLVVSAVDYPEVSQVFVTVEYDHVIVQHWKGTR